MTTKPLVTAVRFLVLVLRSTPGSSFETRFFIPDQIQVVDLEKFERNISWNQSHPTLFEKLVCPVSWVWILMRFMQQTDQNTGLGMTFERNLVSTLLKKRVLRSSPVKKRVLRSSSNK